MTGKLKVEPNSRAELLKEELKGDSGDKTKELDGFGREGGIGSLNQVWSLLSRVEPQVIKKKNKINKINSHTQILFFIQVILYRQNNMIFLSSVLFIIKVLRCKG